MISPYTLAILFGIAIIGIARFRRKASLPLPPGPRKLPIIGNLLDVSPSFEWLSYTKWGKEYNSGIIHLNIVGQSIIVINSVEIANELLDKRSSIFSDRPSFVMMNELVGWDRIFGFMKYGEYWRAHRAVFQKQLHPNASIRYQPSELRIVRENLYRFLDTPDQFMEHTRHIAGALSMGLAYGIKVQPHDDPFIYNAEQALRGLEESSVPGRFLVDAIPMLKYVPEWMPGAGFKKQAKVWRNFLSDMMELPFAAVKRDIARGIVEPSYASSCLESIDKTRDVALQEKIIRSTATGLYGGMVDTTVASLNNFFLAMVCQPEVQSKAQKELDRVLTPGHLPDFDDEKSLPYMTALVKELLRWYPATPIGIPHYLAVDDVFEGYHLPANSVVIGNAWAMLHDEAVYPNPSVFNPDRFLKDGQLNPDVRDPAAAFGFGRRICPGQHVAMSTLWIAAASILATFNISKAVDENGLEIEPKQEFHSALVPHVLPFKCSIRPRSKEAQALVRSSASSD